MIKTKEHKNAVTSAQPRDSHAENEEVVQVMIGSAVYKTSA